jgi:hypothetical protein
MGTGMSTQHDAGKMLAENLGAWAKLLGRPAAVDQPGIRRTDGSVDTDLYINALRAAITARTCPVDGNPLSPGRVCNHPVHGGDWVLWSAEGTSTILQPGTSAKYSFADSLAAWAVRVSAGWRPGRR